MPSDSIVVGEDWISEHYFTTDSTKESFQARGRSLRKDWDEREGQRRADSPLAARGREIRLCRALRDSTVARRRRKTDATPSDPSRIRTPAQQPSGYHDARWRPRGHRPGHDRSRRGHGGLRGPAASMPPPVDDLEDVLSKEATLLERFTPEDETEADHSRWHGHCSVAVHGRRRPHVRCRDGGPVRWSTEQERWAEGRYLAVDVQLVSIATTPRTRRRVDRASCDLRPRLRLMPTSTARRGGTRSSTTPSSTRSASPRTCAKAVRRVHRDHRQRGRPTPRGSGARAAADERREGARPPVAALPLPDPLPAVRRGLARDGCAAGRRPRVHAGLRPRPAARTDAGRHRRGVPTAAPTCTESLATLFRLVDNGHDAGRSASTMQRCSEGLDFHPLKADLFARPRPRSIDEAQLGDGALQRVLQHLLLTRGQAGRAATAASSPTRNSASTSSAPSTRA